MHNSLVELAQQAPLCSDPAMVRGILAESQDLARNAIDHNESPHELVAWYSQLVTDVLHSEGVRSLTNGADIVLTGPVGRGDALPSSPIKWLTVGDSGTSSAPLTALLQDIGLNTEETPFGAQALTKQQWEERIAEADGAGLAIFADAGTWFLRAVLDRGDHAALLTEARRYELPAVQTKDGLPIQDVPVNIRQDLLYPIIAIARWASVAAGSEATSTPERVEAATKGGVLNEAQASDLLQAWDAGLQLQFRRFADRVHTSYTTAAYLLPIQRSTFGAAARMVSGVMRSLG
ncbi:nucleotidyltransferase [Corynebacterium sp. 153RC1]|uniref:putative nucleotidyltransferase substrate binding domain-containing protein n=1 Tax=unclassified Corynebacterium TaxID=2624378 RepID=UPI00211C40C2|nr:MULTISPECIES: putative nucleotidyltransferase substrate binding domain-containing protein [unclassified Corynebacterium]MCQ9371647.1 nucleotidyltransferase [Corynebacterium sp. 35RC1]MCQ9353485.1 nucleotidyltransferase [Corynebacterium sp. 209RC1]MCQ9355721.1 nucleotidyltransferase [Corynebacterium sp. 1222RC1]MCQ9357899.1 nucleotidyltransferase [Corynebacterium sp. 122RC1]MCQ9360095.1 nucleotidyltransferase [Corynebacterium sp. 142RC1]